MKRKTERERDRRRPRRAKSEFYIFTFTTLHCLIFPTTFDFYMATMVIKPLSFHNTLSSSFQNKRGDIFLSHLLRKNNGHIALHNEISLISMPAI